MSAMVVPAYCTPRILVYVVSIFVTSSSICVRHNHSRSTDIKKGKRPVLYREM